MKQLLILSLAALACGPAALARQQTTPRPPASDTQGARPQATPRPTPRPVQRPSLDLSDLGVQIAPDARLLVVEAALDAAGWDPTPRGADPSAFRAQLRRDLTGLDPTLRERLRSFYERSKLKDPSATPAEQAARYVSLAYTLGPAPGFEAPPRSDDLPAGVLEVLDFAPLVREFYRQSGLDDKLPAYLEMHRAAGDELRRPAIEMARAVLAFLNTRPETAVYERVEVPAPAGQKKDDKRGAQRFVTREKERRFLIVPDLLAAPGAVNFRVVADDYFAIIPAGADPRASEVRRAYIQYVVDPLVARAGKDVAARRADLKLLLDKERARGGRDLTPDVFLSVSRALVAAADARMDESARLRALQIETSQRLQAAGSDQAAREAALADSKARTAAIQDETTAQLAEAYERGAVLAFYFAEQLRGLEGSGFDVGSFVAPMLTDFNVAREQSRPAEYAPVVARVAEARRLAREARASDPQPEGPQDPKRAALIKSLSDVDDLLRLKNYEAAEERLLALRAEFREEPRIYFGLGQAAMLAAAAAFDETLQEQRLSSALQHFRQAVLFASPDADRALLSRTHASSARILAFLQRRDEALTELEAALALGDVAGGAYKEALAEKKKLTGQ